MKSLQQQRGVGITGFALISIVVCFALLFAFKLIPAYLEHLSVSQSMSGLKNEENLPVDSTEAKIAIRKALQRRFDINDVRQIKARQVQIISTREGFDVVADYEVTVKIFADIDIVLHFNDQVSIKRADN